MPDSSTTVSHDGVVVTAEVDRVRVKITTQSACAACHARSMCPAADTRDKFIDAITTEPLAPGDTVRVIMKEKAGWRAVMVAFLVPFVLLMTVLLTVNALTGNPVTAGLTALGSLAPYFLIVYALRHRLARGIEFSAVRK